MSSSSLIGTNISTKDPSLPKSGSSPKKGVVLICNYTCCLGTDIQTRLDLVKIINDYILAKKHDAFFVPSGLNPLVFWEGGHEIFQHAFKLTNKILRFSATLKNTENYFPALSIGIGSFFYDDELHIAEGSAYQTSFQPLAQFPPKRLSLLLGEKEVDSIIIPQDRLKKIGILPKRIGDDYETFEDITTFEYVLPLKKKWLFFS